MTLNIYLLFDFFRISFPILNLFKSITQIEIYYIKYLYIKVLYVNLSWKFKLIKRNLFIKLENRFELFIRASKEVKFFRIF